jgi:hypothetical protein
MRANFELKLFKTFPLLHAFNPNPSTREAEAGKKKKKKKNKQKKTKTKKNPKKQLFQPLPSSQDSYLSH